MRGLALPRRPDGDRRSADGPASRARGGTLGRDVLRPVGRVALWGCLGLVLVRGLGDVLAGQDEPSAVAPHVTHPEVVDDETRAFAVGFSRAYLGLAPGEEAERERRLAAFMPTELRDRAAARLPRRGPGERVAEATVARVADLGGSRALITVACQIISGAREVTRYVSVPVAHDAAGGLVVFDLPALSAPPGPGRPPPERATPLAGRDAGAIVDVTRRFLAAYLAGEELSVLRYFLAPGATVAPMAAGLRLMAVDGAEQVGSEAGSRRRVLASVRVADRISRVTYPLRYRLGLLRADRWLVTGLAGGPR